MANKPTPVKPHPVRKKPVGRFHHGDLREAAIVEASLVIERDGAPAVSLRKIARKLGVTNPALYRHFKGRDQLLAEVGLRGYLDATRRMAEAAEGSADVRSALLGAARAYLHVCVENVGWFRLTHSRDFQDEYGRLEQAPVLGELAERAERAVKARLCEVVHADDADDYYRAFWALAVGLSTLVAERAFRRVETDAERLAVAERVLALQVDTLLAGARRH
ncbi:MAG: TetR/AcrR family transcriptional regulator [Myxococcales bacterium]|nr:TetR/AcrR family transcriptional regulator [Myxococcales bacterium]